MANRKSITDQLKEPFDPFDIEWRVQSVGKTNAGKLWAIVIPYVTNRAIQERLDEVCSVEGWKNKFTDTPNSKGVLCGISIKFKSGDEYEWITKYDGAEETAVEAVKGGLSSAMKRAAVQWGIGRYLYRLEAVILTPLDKQPANMADYIMTPVKIEGKRTRIYFSRPKLPVWAIPSADEETDGEAS
jgi:hypothetical protein